MKNKKHTVSKFDESFMNEFGYDYVIRKLTVLELSNKYAMSKVGVKTLISRRSLHEDRLSFDEMTLQKSIERESEYVSKIMAEGSKWLYNEFKKMVRDQNDNVRASLEKIKLVASLYRDMKKEWRLDNDQPTDVVIAKVEVEFIGQVPDITQNSRTIIDVEPTDPVEKSDQKQIQQPAEKSPTPEEVEISAFDSIIDES